MRKLGFLVLSVVSLLLLTGRAFVDADSGAGSKPQSHKHAASDHIQQINPSAATVQLQPFLSGLTAPLLVTNAHDGSNRLFIVQQNGMILVLQPGSSTPTTFLNISSLITFGGEQGLIGMAFHPLFWQNGKFYVHYSRASDGQGTIAEYRVSTSNPNVADPTTARILLTIPQPFTNHNGGMIEFGPDGFLYIGKGDGGSAFDPGNRAQNLGVMNGKILRIDVDHTNGSVPYAIPSDNPFKSTPGALPEIFSYGMRNPFRFSFDKGTGQLYCGDVGQNDWEEADIITSGGNYGWRIFEGDTCTMIDPCVSTGLVFPIFVYGHTMGRCAILGGYVYRGTLNTMAQGLYTYGDLCSAEIFTFDGTNQTVIANLGTSISSFGQDESGELYVCGINAGTVSKIEPVNPCVMSLGSSSASFGAGSGTGSFTINDPGGCAWSSFSNASWITVTSGGSGSTTGTLNFSVAANTAPGPRLGTISVAGSVFKITQGGTTPNFVGFVDHPGCDTIGGWAADRNALNTSIDVEIFDGTTLLTTVTANNSRPDVGTFLGDNGLHGFSIPTPMSLKDGATHSVHVKFETSATELTHSPFSLTCSSSPTPSYVGFVDHAGCDNIRGWAADRNRLNTAINVEVFDGSTLVTTILANGSRPDVGTFLGDNGLHGFNIPTPSAFMDGATHSLHVKFETSTTELSGSPSSLMCSASTPPNYIGFVDHAGCDSIAGWVADRNRLNTPINAEIFDGTTLIAIVLANNSRPDVGTFLGDNGLHGFSITTPDAMKTGTSHQIHVKFETSTTELSASPAAVSCSVATPNYVGFVDHMGCDSIGGWAADRGRLNTPITVSLYDGSVLLATMQANGSRPDVGTFLGDNGLHGYSFTLPASLHGGQTHTVHIKFETSSTELTHSPGNLTCP